MGNPTVTPITENWHMGGYIVSEQRGHFSRDQVTIASGQSLLAGTVLGKTNSGATGAAAALGTNTGNGAIGTITLTAAAGNGSYALIMLSATNFVVEDSNGVEVGHGVAGSVFTAGGLSFTLTAGGTAFAAGDSFTITVSGGVEKYSAFDPTATNGLQNAVAVLYGDTNATAADKHATITARASEVNFSELVWGANVTTTPQQTAAKIALASRGIVSR